ncbi:DegT/DnrJ/EryC1/StrS family aminotransferase [Phycisphaera mikurensis]|uniref:Putative aminotransferase n=1 Tax=Phycisphaera mikurensis (strain NBRC 102666 / KCTC 22515 / FYK2301M01) TaxID=1142394 RepID=I0IG35_PHYMF|nr:DegT/DnrJ/EryC1/StrS family aminotransferase [Phycisphaera mikurensis]MBB6440393.1 dTDP-4-amino-4,6-dideoxygalactose transaminase [Phycisphaera mikurensis]BAM04223.1 putative aminotransferase [Phycisphaera mikurensis NBRC 102666]
MSVPILDLSEQHKQLMPQLREAFVDVIESGRLVLGHYVERFERELAQSLGVKHAVGVSSGTDGLALAFMALNLGPGDEVIVSPFSYLHTAEAITRVGATPVFCDINPRTFNLDPEALEGAITPRTQAIVAVHLYGLPCPMRRINELAERHGLKVVEDADMAIGASYHGAPAGSLGDLGVISFYPTKSLAAAGDAGAVVTDDDAVAERLRNLRVHGLKPGYIVDEVGGAFRMDPLQAAFLSVKLPLLPELVDKRRGLAKRYKKLLESMPVTTPDSAEDIRHAYNLYTLRVRGGGREPLRHHLDAKEIGNRVYYPRPLHLQPVYAHLGYEKGSLPAAERAADEVLSIPMYSDMSLEQQDEVVGAVRDYFMGD